MRRLEKKVWLDDERPAPEGWTHVHTAREAMLALAAGDVDELSLDHDLGKTEAVGNGMQVVEWMRKTGIWPARKPKVHSANLVEAPRMIEVIARYGPYVGSVKSKWIPQRHSQNDIHFISLSENVLGTHRVCPDPFCCTCVCPGCMTEWRIAQKPEPSECPAHLAEQQESEAS